MADWYEKKSFARLVEEAAARWGTREALCHEDGRWSFEAVAREVDCVARGFLALGIEPGDKVVLWMPNRPEWLFAFFALSKIGAVVVPVNSRFRATDLEYVVRQSDATALITVDRSGPIDYLGLTEAVVPEISLPGAGPVVAAGFPQLRHVVVLGSGVLPPRARAWGDVLTAGGEVAAQVLERRHREVDPDDTALMLYTSGTTGFPKGVMHGHNLQRNVTDIANRLGYRVDDVMLMNWPLFHVVGLYIGPLLTMLVGVRMVLTTTFDAAESLRLVEREGVTRLWGFDTQLNALVGEPVREHVDLSSLRMGLGAVGMVSSEDAAKRTQTLLCPTVSGWGMTEIGAGVTLGYPDGPDADRWLTSGFPLPGLEFKVIDPETGHAVAFGELGELCARGYSVMQGYYHKPEETARAVDAQGWLHTGDMATLREDGAIRFLGRYKDLLKVGGENVDPAEVESFLLRHPAVAQVQVVAMPDARLGEVVCACVVPERGQSVTNEMLADFCRGELASFKIPRRTLVMDAFPMTASGKAQKFKLRQMAHQSSGSGLAK